jgi:hypothetical protein
LSNVARQDLTWSPVLVVHAEERSHSPENPRLRVEHRDLGRRTNSPAYREIEKQALNSRLRTIFDPPRREFLRKYFNVPVENVRKFSRVERISLSQRARLSARAGFHREPARGNSSAESGMIKTRVRLA